MRPFQGTWLTIKSGDDYCDPEFLEFDNGEVLHLELLKKVENGCLTKTQKWTEKLSETKYQFINKNRLRFYRIGKTHTVISDTEAITRDTIYETDYVRIESTETILNEKDIIQLEFKAEWNEEKILIAYNKTLDSKTIQEINKRLKREGKKLILEKLEDTYFASIYYHGKRSMLIPIRTIDKNKILLYGFPKEPYEVIGKIIK